ncbi:MAG: DUF4145 domain-containing protein [Acidobacteriaceae bacterium]
MTDQAIDPQLIREWVYQALHKPMPNHIPGLHAVLREVYSAACRENYLAPRMAAPNLPASPDLANIPPDLQNEIRGVIWDLIIQGIIVPGIPNQLGNSGLPSFVITEWGKKALESHEYISYDASRYIQKIKDSIPNVDEAVVLYLKEALRSFRAGAYVASAVMTGVASEKVLLLLREEVGRALPSERAKKFLSATNRKSTYHTYKEIWSRLEPRHQDLANHMKKDDIKVELAGIFDLIRKTRNDAGHPTGREISRDEADSILHLFPIYCKTAYATFEWLKSNSL